MVPGVRGGSITREQVRLEMVMRAPLGVSCLGLVLSWAHAHNVAALWFDAERGTIVARTRWTIDYALVVVQVLP